MATVNWSSDIYGFGFRFMIQDDLAKFGTIGGSTTSVRVIGTMIGILPGQTDAAVVVSDIYSGSFQQGPLTDPVSGTINSIERQSGGSTIGGVSGIAISYTEAVETSRATGWEDSDALFAREFAGDDQLISAGAADDLQGYAGNDLLSAGAGDDVLDGGVGADSLYSGDGEDLMWGADGDDFLSGGSGDDYMYADSGSDYLTAGLGHEVLYGDEGADFLSGEGGNDHIEGEAGVDTLFGGDSNDTSTAGLSGIC